MVGAGLALDAVAAAGSLAVAWLRAPALAASLLSSPEHAIYIRLSTVGTAAFLATSTLTACLRLADRYAVIGLANSVTALLQGVATFGVYVVSMDRVAYLILVSTGAQLLRLGWLGIGVYRRVHQPVAFRGALGILRSHMRFLLATYVTGTLRGCAKLADGLLLGFFSTPGDVGRYRIAKKVVQLLVQAIDPLYQALYPKLSKIFAERRLRLFWLTNVQVTAVSALLIGGGAFALSFMTPIFVSLLGEGYAGAVGLIRLMVWNPIFWALSLWGPATAMSLGLSGLVAVLETVNLSSLVGLSALLVGAYGGTGLAVAFTVARIVSALGWVVVLPSLVRRARRSAGDEELTGRLAR